MDSTFFSLTSLWIKHANSARAFLYFNLLSDQQEIYSVLITWVFLGGGGQTNKQTNKTRLTVHSLSQVSILPTPGHTGQDVSIEVKGLSGGTALVAGDLFECCDDEGNWQELSMDAALQEVHRQRALQSADIIIPGHGQPFRVLRSWWSSLLASVKGCDSLATLLEIIKPNKIVRMSNF